jgi:hypothetical protein
MLEELKKKQEELELKRKKKREREKNDIKKLLKLPEFRRFVWRKWGEWGLLKDTFTQNSNQTAYNCGQRLCALNLLADMNDADSKAFPQMQAEYISEQLSKKQEETND